ncbi:glycosyltransferase family 4 protein [Micromonospora sp. NBRC 101691]|uniref:glycosyltransferase family 4 protein n=1 Tax=Micromonospora sp. NBRC 101691 TaxID=3032198 RepID=UPI0024A16B19|nr:glycosyltransferase family 4 protein [Micromonospora sp. NBRC 101691]GLY21581.1 hypothetical protein Misp04_13130 [Micromonospora sp. NBRC 101691]
MSANPRKAVYVALGPHRVRAAERQTAELVAAGTQVVLVAPDLPEWADVDLPAGVPVHRVGGADARATSRAARHLLRASDGPLRDADLVVAGDAYAFPAVWEAARRDLVVALEPVAEPGRRPAPADLAVVTPWYPSPNNPLAGAFVEATIGAVRGDHPRISILHTEDWPYRYDVPTAEAIRVAAERLTGRLAGPGVRDTPAGELTRVPVPISSRREYATWALAHVAAMRQALPTGRIEAPVVHAHTGIYGGVVAARLARPEARVVVTEHASFLRPIFQQAAARRLYEEALQRADVFLCVSQHLRDEVCDQFPHHAHKVRVVPNAIDFDGFAMRPDPPQDLLRWLYVGRLSEQKGVHILLSAFTAVAAEEPRATLTLVGSGPLVERVRELAGRSDLAGRIDLRAAVPPAEVPALMRTHDLLVHASPAETFGMTVVEAVASGTPVLVAGSQGPQETLSGLNGRAGLLVEVSDDPAVLVDGFRTLRGRRHELDLPAARAVLVERYGRASVRARLQEVFTAPEAGPAGDVTPAAPATALVATTPSAPARVTDAQAARVVLVAISPPQFKLVREYVDRVLERGYGVDVITNDPEQWRRSDVDERVRLLPLDAAERRRPLLRAERLVVFRVPGKVFSVAKKRARSSETLWPELVVSNLQRTHGKMAKSFHTSVFYAGYRLVRPKVLWRIVQRDVLPKLDLPATERVVVAGVYGVTIGWQLARRRPGMTVTTSLVPPESRS